MENRILYKVTVKTDLMVMADGSKEAETIAKKNAWQEVEHYGQCSSRSIRDMSELSNDWKDNVPYAADLKPEFRTCSNIIEYDLMSKEEKSIEEVAKIKEDSKPSKVIIDSSEEKLEEVVPETKPSPKPRDLEMGKTQSGRSLPPLRFNIPGGC